MQSIKFVKGKTAPRIKDISKKRPRVEDGLFERVLNAKPVLSTKGLDAYSVAHAAENLLFSAKSDPIDGKKIPKIDLDWEKLSRIAIKAGLTAKYHPSNRQVAEFLLLSTLDYFSESTLEDVLKTQIDKLDDHQM